MIETIIEVAAAALRHIGHEAAADRLVEYKSTIANAVSLAQGKGLSREQVIAEVKKAMTAASDAQMRDELGE